MAKKIKCPCEVRMEMDWEQCDRTDCEKCCPLAQEESEDDTDDT